MCVCVCVCVCMYVCMCVCMCVCAREREIPQSLTGCLSQLESQPAVVLVGSVRRQVLC